MTISQLEYAIAIYETGHFGKAAEMMHVTQPTLSMMIKKLEDELGVVLFDRSSKPIVASQIGELVIQQARRVLTESNRINDLINNFSEELVGSYSLGVIPTIAPTLVPGIVSEVEQKFPAIELKIYEAQTEELIEHLLDGRVDAAILATPIGQKNLVENPLFYEEFFVFGELGNTNEFLLPNEIDPEKLWLLEKGHCLRAQIINLCELKKPGRDKISYNSGSLETIIEIVRQSNSLTILPELTARKLSKKDQKLLRQFHKPAPYREMSLVYHQFSAKHKFFETIEDIIEDIIPLSMRKLKSNSRVVEIFTNAD